MQRWTYIVFALALGLAATQGANAANRDNLTAEGYVVDSSGTAAEGSASVTFRLYSQSSGGSALWSETQTVTFTHGVYSAILGSSTALPDDLFDNDPLYLGLQLSGASELSPRTALSAVPWVLNTDVADIAASLADGTVSSSDLPSGSITTDKVSDGTITNTDISASASIAWAKISKSGASASDISAASVSHTHGPADITGTLSDAQISDTLTVSILSGSGSSTNAVDLATAEISGVLPLANLTDGNTSTHPLFAGGAGGDPAYRAITDAEIPDTITAGAATQTVTLASNGSNCSDGQYPRGIDAAGASENCTAISSTTSLPHFALTRRFGFIVPVDTASGSLTGIALGANLGASGGFTGEEALTNATRLYIQANGSDVANEIVGLTVSAQTRQEYRPRLSTTILTDTALTDRRIWVGIANHSLYLQAPTIAPTDNSVAVQSHVGVAYQGSVSANWLCCASDNDAVQSCTSMGLAVVAATEYTITVDWRTSGSVTCTVNATTITHSSNVTTATGINYGYTDASTDLVDNDPDEVVRHNIASVVLEQN